MEIYIKDCSLAEIQKWLESIFSTVPCLVLPEFEPVEPRDENIYFDITYLNKSIRVIARPGIGKDKKFTSIWFNDTCLPWKTYDELASLAQVYFNKTVRYETEDRYSDAFYELDGKTKQKVLWEEAG